MRRVLFVLFLQICTPLFANPIGTLDQAVEYLDSGYASGPSPAQVFTVGRAGILSRVEFSVRLDNRQERGSVELHLLAVTNDDRPSHLPSDDLASATIELLNPGGGLGAFTWAGIDLSIPVSKGDKFAIAVGNPTNPAQPVQLQCYFSQRYEGGGAFYLSGFGYERWGVRDTVQGFHFRTYVADIPEPSTLALGGGMLLSLAALRRRK